MRRDLKLRTDSNNDRLSKLNQTIRDNQIFMYKVLCEVKKNNRKRNEISKKMK